MKTKKQKTNKGITLIALVITIIVMIILAGVAINLAINSDGLFSKANESVKKWNEAIVVEEEALQDILEIGNNIVNESTKDDEEIEDENGPIECLHTNKVVKNTTSTYTGDSCCADCGMILLYGKETVVLSKYIANPENSSYIYETIKYEDGMTWGQWYTSAYNNGIIKKENDGYFYLVNTDEAFLVPQSYENVTENLKIKKTHFYGAEGPKYCIAYSDMGDNPYTIAEDTNYNITLNEKTYDESGNFKTNNPISNTEITINKYDNTYNETITTNAEGIVILTNLSEGEYNLSCVQNEKVFTWELIVATESCTLQRK